MTDIQNSGSNPDLLTDPPADGARLADAADATAVRTADEAAQQETKAAPNDDPAAPASPLPPETPAETPGASTPAPKAVKGRGRRRGPPADGQPESRVAVLLTTSRYRGADGQPLRRGRAVSVPERRVESLILQGRVRRGAEAELTAALKLGPLVELG
jgi:hypothetical protein